MLRQGIPHRREAGDEVVWTGEGAQKVEDDSPTLIIAHGIADGQTARKVIAASQFSRQLTPVIPVAIEVAAGDGDGQYEEVKGAVGAKRSVAKPLTWRIPVSQAVCGAGHTLLMYHQAKDQSAKQETETGLRAWGENGKGQLGLGHRRPVSSMTQAIPFFRTPQAKCGVKMIAAGGEFSMAVLKDGRVLGWGSNDRGQLGLGLLGAQLLPRRRGEAWSEISEFSTGGTVARSERIFPGDRVQGWQIGEHPRVMLQGLHDSCEDRPLGIQEQLEEELLGFYLGREDAIARLRAEIADLKTQIDESLQQEGALDTRFEAELEAVTRRYRSRLAALDDEYEAELQALSQAAEEERAEDGERHARARAVLQGVCWGLWNGANARAASVWRLALSECEQKRQHRKNASQAARNLSVTAPTDQRGALEQVIHVAVTCVSAWNLPKMDVLGSCDAFVQLRLGGQHHRTSLKKNTYAPAWNETFVMEARGDELLLQVFDWDLVGANDLVGEAVVSSTDLQIGLEKEETREFQLRRDQEVVIGANKQVATLRIKWKCEVQAGANRLRTSAASRQPKVRVFITRITAQHLPKMDGFFGKCDAYCDLLLGGEKATTAVKKNTYAPSWEEDITMETKGGDLVVRVYDWDRTSANDLIGNMHVAHDELLRAMGGEQRVTRELHATDGTTVIGHDGSPSQITVFWKCEMVNRDGSARLSLPPPELFDVKKFDFVLRCVSAEHLPKMDAFGSCDPFVELEIGHQKHKTQVKKNTLEPVFEQDFSLEADGGDLLLRVMDWNLIGQSDLVGSARVGHAQLFSPVGPEQTLQLELSAADGQVLIGADGRVAVLSISWKVTDIKDGHHAVTDAPGGPTEVVSAGGAGAKSEGAGNTTATAEHIIVRCVGARHLPKVDTFGSCDAYLDLRLGGHQMKTKVVKNTLEPVWEEKFELEAKGEALLVRLMDWDRLKKDEQVGVVWIPHHKMLNAVSSGAEDEFELVDEKGAAVFGKDGKASVVVLQFTGRPSVSPAQVDEHQVSKKTGTPNRTLPPPPPKPDAPTTKRSTLPAPPVVESTDPKDPASSSPKVVSEEKAAEAPALFVKVLSAEHLPKMDWGLGKCDPFVELELGGQKRSTSVKKKTYTPTWDEEFELQATGFDLVVRVLDWDQGSKNDVIGETRVGHEEIMAAVDGGHQLLGVRLHRDGKAVKGKDGQEAMVRLQIRSKTNADALAPVPAADMPSKPRRRRESLSVSPQGVPLRLWLTCISASHLPKMDFTGKCDGFCEIELAGQKEKTQVVKSNYDPEWNETFELEARGSDLRLRLKDWDLASAADVVGDAVVTHQQMLESMGRNVTLHLELVNPKDGSVVQGRDKETSIVTVSIKSEELGARRGSGAETSASAPRLVITCVSANNLPKTDTFGSCDPFVELELGSQAAKTEVKEKSLSPEWMQSFEMDATGSDLLIRVLDWDRLSKNDLVGSAQIAHEMLVGSAGKEQERELELIGADGRKVMGKDGRWAVVTIRWRIREVPKSAASANKDRSVRRPEPGLVGWLKADLLWFRGEASMRFNETPVIAIAAKRREGTDSAVESVVFRDQRTSQHSLNLRVMDDSTELAVKLLLEDGEQRRKLLGEAIVPIGEILRASEAPDFDGRALGPRQPGGWVWTRCLSLTKKPTTYPATFRFLFSEACGLDGAAEEKECRMRCLGRLDALEAADRQEEEDKLAMKLKMVTAEHDGRRERVEAVYFINGQKFRAKHADAAAALLKEKEHAYKEMLRRSAAAQRILERRHGEDARTSEMVRIDLDLDAHCKRLDEQTARKIERCRATASSDIATVDSSLGEAKTAAEEASALEAGQTMLWFERYREELLAAVDEILLEAETSVEMVKAEENKLIADWSEQAGHAETTRSNRLQQDHERLLAWYHQREKELTAEREAEIVRVTDRGEGNVESGATALVSARRKLREKLSSVQTELGQHMEEQADEGGGSHGLVLVLSDRVGLVDLESERKERRRRERLTEREPVSAGQTREEKVWIRRVEDQTQPVLLWVLDVVTSGRGVRQVACGAGHAMAVTTAGELWAWGSNAHGELALGDRRRRYIPKRVSIPGELTTLKSVGCGDGYSMAVLLGDAGATVVMGWGRNERDQLGLNQRSEIRAWLRRMARQTGWQHPGAEDAVFRVERGDEVAERLVEMGVVSWGALRQLTAADVTRVAQHLALSTSSVEDWERAMAALDACYPENTRSRQGDGRVRWEYSAHDHLDGVVVPQGILVTRDGKAVFNLGADVPGAQCQCGPHAGVATSQMTCVAHGPAVLWTRDMAKLNVFPPEFATGVDKTKGGPVVTSRRVAEEWKDVVRVGVYPQDTGLAGGLAPRMQAGLKNVQDGPQHGTQYVRLQVRRLEESFQDPMQTSANDFFFDGAVHFPFFHPGRKPVERVLCGSEYSVVQLENGELRFLGNMASALARLQTKPARRPRHAAVHAQVRKELMKGDHPESGFHLDICGAYHEVAYSVPVKQETLLVRAIRGAQRPRSLLRITFSQLQHLAFPHHTP